MFSFTSDCFSKLKMRLEIEKIPTAVIDSKLNSPWLHKRYRDLKNLDMSFLSNVDFTNLQFKFLVYLMFNNLGFIYKTYILRTEHMWIRSNLNLTAT